MPYRNGGLMLPLLTEATIEEKKQQHLYGLIAFPHTIKEHNLFN